MPYRGKSLKAALIARFALTATIPIFAVCLLALSVTEWQVLGDAQVKNLMLARGAAGQIEMYLKEPVGFLGHIQTVLSHEGRGMTPGELEKILDDHVEDNEIFEAIYILDKTGRVAVIGLKKGLRHMHEEHREIDLSGNAFVMEAIRTGRTTWSDSYLSLSGGKPSLTVCIPTPRGAIAGNINIGRLQEFTRKSGGPNVTVAVVDGAGTVISHTEREYMGRNVNLRNFPVVLEALAGRESTREYSLEGEKYLGSAVSIAGPRWIVLVSQPLPVAAATMKRLLAIFVGGGVLSIGLALVLAILQARKFSEQFSQLSDRMDKVAKGTYDTPIPELPYAEVRTLAESFKEMASIVHNREKYLRNSEIRYRQLTESTHAIPWEYDASADRFLYVGPQAEKILGYPPAMWTDIASVAAAIHPEDREESVAQWRSKIEAGENHEIQCRVIDASGNIHWIHNIVTILGEKGRRKLVGIMLDITALKKAEQEKSELEVSLRQSQKMEAIGSLAGGIAHDFNNLLQPISGFATLALQELPPDARVRVYVTEISTAAERASELVRRLLTFSRKDQPEKRIFRIAGELENAVKLLEFTIPKMIRIQLVVPKELPFIFGNPAQIGQAVLNLCTNARDAMPDGGTLRIEADDVLVGLGEAGRPEDMAPGRYVVIRVRDTGIGMDAETKRKIFDPFFTTKGAGKGTGLGLSIVYGIVSNHNGWVTCESAPGSGSTFEIYLPAAAEAAESRVAEEGQAQGAAPVAAAPPGEERRILVADDEPGVLSLAVTILENCGYTVDAVESGEAALEAYLRKGVYYDLVILDLGMPGMGGFKCLEAIRSINPGARVIIASGYISDKQAEDIRKVGALIIAKPYSVTRFLETVRGLLDRTEEGVTQ